MNYERVGNLSLALVPLAPSPGSPIMKCPVCRASYSSLRSSSTLCRRCGVDLLPLIKLHDQALWYHKQAIQSLKDGDYVGATAQNNQALALYYNNADFQTLTGQLWALQGKFQQAIAAWKKAQQINPHHSRSGDYLKCLLGNDLKNKFSNIAILNELS